MVVEEVRIMSFQIISTNEHVIEAPDVWTARMSKAQWGDRIPHIRAKDDGAEVWMIDGVEVPLVGSGSAAACMPDRSDEPTKWRDVPSVVTNVTERAAAMEAQGVGYAVLYPSVAGIGGETFGRIEDPELELACVQAYNDWLIDEWGANPKFIPQCVLPLSSFGAMRSELIRSVEKGHRGVILPGIPDQVRKGAPHINDAGYDAVWKACEEFGVPVCFHSGIVPSMELTPYSGYAPAVAAAFRAIARPVTGAAMLSNFVISKVFERFPGLKVVFAESAMGLTSFTIEGGDYGFGMWRLDERYSYKAKPSDLFRSNCFVVGWYDRVNLKQVAEHLGSDSLLWTTKFPLGTSSWPDVQKQAESSFAEISESDRARVMWSNAAQLYKIN
jgi:predicted TIM-barrel fold metal-dependent hydrolase